MDNSINTPFFLIHEDVLDRNIFKFKEALEKEWPYSVIAYSVKTNALPWILGWMNRHGVYAEVVSDEEYQLALLSGYSTENIVFNGPIKSEYYLRKALLGGAVVNIDSAHELACLEQDKPDIRGMLGVRVNVDPTIFEFDDVGYQEDGFRFGFGYENGELTKAINTLSEIYEDIQFGLHFHVNSITRSINVYRAIARYAAKIICETKLHPKYIDIGGGFFGGVPGKTTPEEYIRCIKCELENVIDICKTKLIIEPGSAAIGSAIDLHTSVIDVKDTVHGRIVTTDGSRIHIDPLWLKKNYMYSMSSKKQSHHRQVICGYTCMDHDRIMVIEDKPELCVGDRITYHRVGNYTVTFGGPFIRPFPAVYVKTSMGNEIIRKQMTVEDYYRMETV